MGKKRSKGPRGGVRLQPGKGHDRKSGLNRKRKFAEEAAKKRLDQKAVVRKEWEQWDNLTDEQKKLRPDLKPTKPRPTVDDQIPPE